MKLRFIGLFSSALLAMSFAARANEVGSLAALNFVEGNRQNIQAMVSKPNACADLLQTAIAAHAAHNRTSRSEPVKSVHVIDSCQTVSLSHDGNLEVVSTVDLENGNGPLSYIAVFKRSGFLDEADIPVGEGNGALGPVSLGLQDINHDGRLELVEKSRVTYADGHIVANVDPAPTVTNIYVWRNDSFVLSTAEFRNYISAKVLPVLRQQLGEIEQFGVSSSRRQKEAQAIRDSITFADRFLHTGQYFPGSNRK